MLEWVPVASLVLSALNAVALIALARNRDSREERRRLTDRIEQLEREAATVDSRIKIACHERVKRSGEYWEFHNRVETFMDDVRALGLFRRP